MADEFDIDRLVNDAIKTEHQENLGQPSRSYLESIKQHDVKRLTQIWVNERVSPELLPFETQLVERVMAHIKHQIEFIEETTISGGDMTANLKVTLLIIESELERIKYVMRGYLRVRLFKIDKYARYLAENESGERDRLSQSESAYLDKHLELLDRLFSSQFLSKLPASYQNLNDKHGNQSMIDEPDMDRFVFVRVVKDIETPIQVDGGELEMKKGSIYVLKYHVIREEVESGRIELV